MKFYKNVLRLIIILIVITVLTLVICVVGLNRGRDNNSPLSFAVRKLTINDDGDTMPWLKNVKEVIGIEDNAGTQEPVEEEIAGEELVPLSEFEGDLPRIVCWGDSLTESVDSKTAYPDVLRRLSGAEVINYGIRSDTSFMVAIRAGYVGVYVQDFIMPAGQEPVRVSLRTKRGKAAPLLRYGDEGVNPCFIGGVRGTLSLTEDGYYFTRSESGDTIAVENGTRFTTAGMALKKSSDVLVIFTGTNDSPDRDSIYDVIEYQRGILEYTGCDKYVVVGMTCKQVMPDIEKVNEILSEEYAEHFLDIREFMLSEGLEYEGLSPTAQDRQDIANGEIPSSLRNDYVHGNKYFYDILGNKIYEKMQYLGYLPPAQQL